MHKFNLTALSVAICLAISTSAIGGTIPKAEYNATKDDISARYKSDKSTCKELIGNAGDICIKEARGREKVATAELEAIYNPSMKHRYDVRISRADATYAVAKEKCDGFFRNAKDTCLKEAKNAHVAAKADAKFADKGSDPNAMAYEMNTDARRDAIAEERYSAYDIEKGNATRLPMMPMPNVSKKSKRATVRS